MIFGCNYELLHDEVVKGKRIVMYRCDKCFILDICDENQPPQTILINSTIHTLFTHDKYSAEAEIKKLRFKLEEGL